MSRRSGNGGRGNGGSSSSHAPALASVTTTSESEPEIDREGSAGAVALRLAIGKDGLGIELARRATFECLDVVELVVRLPHVRFPFDVTGGVARFRHRRGELERIGIEIDARRLARWAEPRLRGLLGTAPCSVTVAPRAFGATITLVSSSPSTSVVTVLAFEVAVVGAPELTLVAHTARGANLPAPATQLAMRVLSTLLGDAVTKREGARFVLGRAADRLGRVLLPDAGVRAPGGADVMLSGSGESDGVLFVAFQRTPVAPPIPQAATLANEAALLTRAADDARFAGDLERARHLDIATLERAPRHAEIARRIAEVDAHVGGRAEAAIATLRSSDRTPYLGRLLGDLLVEAGDVPGAIAALLREGERDPSPAVSALAYARAASLASDPTDALMWLDSAISRAPTLAEIRWDRASRRLAQGRLLDARADFQELEALARGPRDRWEVLRRAAHIHRERGLGAEAATLYERALLYRPEDPEAIAGLGVSIAGEGRAARGATLLARAIEIAGSQTPPLPTSWMELELARVLGDHLGDRPAAVARLRAIADDTPEAIEARGLEGRYRSALGDIAGASLAYARLRERAGREASAVSWLEEAARFEESRNELQLARAHLAAAMAVAPKDSAIEHAYRTISEKLARAHGAKAAPSPSVQIEVKSDPQARDRVTLAAPPEPLEVRERVTLAAPPSTATVEVVEEAVPSPEEDEARIEALTRTLQGDPTNDAVVDELVVRLTRLGRSMELLALLSARIEDAPAERRAELLPRHREVLENLEREARAAGRDGEADLFKMAREAADL